MTILSNANDYNHTIGQVEQDPDWFGDPQGDHLAACHSSYVDSVLMHGLSSILGYRHWIIITTDGIFLNENPYLFASNDKSSWASIVQVDDQGLLDGQGSADPALIYNPIIGGFDCYFKRENPGQTKGIFKRIYNGTLGAATLVIADGALGGMSPAMVRRISTNGVHCWFIKPDGPTGPIGNNQLYYRPLGAGDAPGAEQACTVDSIQDAYSGYYPWHIEARENLFIPGRVDLVIACKVAGGDLYTGMVLVHAITSFDSPSVITCPLAPTLLLAPNAAHWDSEGLYRSSFSLEQDGNNLKMNLAYDGFGGSDADFDRIGFTSGTIQVIEGMTDPVYNSTLSGFGHDNKLSNFGHDNKLGGFR